MADLYDQEVFLEYVEGELPHDGRVEFEKLMLQDARLRNLVAHLVIDRHRVRTLPDEEPPDHLMERVNERLERLMLLGATPGEFGRGVSPAQNLLWRRRLTMGAVVLTFLVVAGVITFTLGKLTGDRPKLKMKPAAQSGRASMAARSGQDHRAAPGQAVEPSGVEAGPLLPFIAPSSLVPAGTLRVFTDDPGRTRKILAGWALEHDMVLHSAESGSVTMLVDVYPLTELVDRLNAQPGQRAELTYGGQAYVPPSSLPKALGPDQPSDLLPETDIPGVLPSPARPARVRVVIQSPEAPAP